MSEDFLPTAKLDVLRQRAGILRKIRQFFDDRGFFEVETPVFSHDVVVDRYLNPIAISKQMLTGVSDDSSRRLWLQTSPEFGMKRLMVAGADAIYQICKSFRQGESGALHNPEFSMLEWYRVGDDMAAGMELLGELVVFVLNQDGAAGDAGTSVEKLTYCEAFKRFANVDPFCGSLADLKSAAASGGVMVDLSDRETDRDGWLNLILSQVVEPQLGVNSPMIVYDWPASQAALSIVRGDDPPVAERFELYVNGVELANGYHELVDAEELARRNSVNNQHRVKDGNDMLPESGRLLRAMGHGMPGCSGVALGVDRLVMIAIGADSIQEVMAFPVDRA